MAGNNADRQRIRRSCTNREVRKVILGALEEGARYRLTKKGIMFFGDTGAITTHFTVSDHRGAKNLRKTLHRIGIMVD